MKNILVLLLFTSYCIGIRSLIPILFSYCVLLIIPPLPGGEGGYTVLPLSVLPFEFFVWISFNRTLPGYKEWYNVKLNPYQIADSQIAESILPISKWWKIIGCKVKFENLIYHLISTLYNFLQSDCLAVFGCRRLSFRQSDCT